MNWTHELTNSALWLGKAYLITLVVFTLVMAGLARTSRWGQQFWAVSGAWFHPRRNGGRWQPLAGVALMLLFVLAGVRMNVLFSYWYNGFYTAMQGLDQKGFWFFMQLFAILAAVHVARTLLQAYIRGAFVIHWREWLNERLLSRWLSGQAYYLGRFAEPAVDNPDQRLQQDVTDFATNTVALAMGLVGALVSIFEFTGILWNLSAPMNVLGAELPRAMVFLVYLYVLVVTAFAVWVGRPLIALNFLNEKLNATYRYLLVRLREYGESIALYRGEAVEQAHLQRGFGAVISNAWGLLLRTIKFEGFNLSASQLAVIFPYLIQAPRMFAGQIKLGDVMQTGEAFGQVQEALSFFRSSYDTFASYRATLDRLSGFEANIAGAQALQMPVVVPRDDALVLHGLTLQRPDGRLLAQNLSLTLPAGQALLIRGPSGSGKTTLLRTLAGLWPYATGTAERPVGTASLFLSQKPYLPLGTLRGALAYPQPTPLDHALACQILEQVQLGQLMNQLDVEQDWSQVLSPGEQQRLAFGRVLANRPAIVFLDEATSATDSGLEHSLYTLLRREPPAAIVVSVGHRETLAAFHDQALSLSRDGSWQLQPTR